MINIYLLNINIDINFILYNQLISYISKEKRERINKYKYQKDKLRSLLGDILVRTQLCKTNNCKLNDLEFEKNSYGKPRLKGNSNMYFNISHSGDYVVVGISNKKIGVDIEFISGKETDLLDLAQRYYSKDEYNWILRNKNELIARNFFTIWTLKESYVKFTGKGLSIPLDTFKFETYNNNMYVKKNDVLIEDIQLKSYYLYNNYILSVCYVSVKILAPLIFLKVAVKYPSKARIRFTRINLFPIFNFHIFRNLIRPRHKIFQAIAIG